MPLRATLGRLIRLGVLAVSLNVLISATNASADDPPPPPSTGAWTCEIAGFSCSFGIGCESGYDWSIHWFCHSDDFMLQFFYAEGGSCCWQA
jgi:hypothetical protein